MKIPSSVVVLILAAFFGLESWTLAEVVSLKVSVAEMHTQLVAHLAQK
jgi:hypothetical protein